MNKLRTLFTAGTVVLLAACSNASFDVEMTEAPEPETMSPAYISITTDGDTVTDFDGTAEFRMVGMDHGTEVADLVHTEDGVYEGEVELPMPGAWTIDVVGESEEHGKIDMTIEVDI